ncbi:unnamed protein product [Lactuca virosa]|uniref:Uncharacterized protein n=1 Tax=Lactuca virosa TaxID=75947 RepID=A0AAU9MRE8_9ASTR|nr:unnamed protein product [Lactuca virosa]
MFNDDDARSALTNMYEYSPVDGFVEISQGLGDMIKSLANEPSMGLFYIQQHTHNAVPNLVSINKNIMTKSREMSLHTEDSEDSITMLRSMKESGFPIVDDMVKDITKSLAIMSSKQPKKGLLISNKSFSGTTTMSGTGSYLSSAFKSAKLKATNLKWASVETSESSMEEELPVSSENGNEDKDELILNLSRSEKFDEFKADKEAKLEEWLGGSDD